MTLNNVKAAAEDAGLAYRGAFHPDKDDLPDGRGGGYARHAWLRRQ